MLYHTMSRPGTSAFSSPAPPRRRSYSPSRTIDLVFSRRPLDDRPIDAPIYYAVTLFLGCMVYGGSREAGVW